MGKQPIMLGWMWQGVLVNAIILSCTTMAVYIWGLSFYLNEYNVADILTQIQNSPNSQDVLDGLVYARTAAFISLVWSENVRAYTSRSFVEPFWIDLCANVSMQIA